MSAGAAIAPSAPLDAVIAEQFRYLVEHWERARIDPEVCASDRELSCPDCVRFQRVKKVLMAPFEKKHV